MSWSIRRPNVQLRVTKFSAEKPVVPANHIKQAIEDHKKRRQRECKKVEPVMGLPR